MQQFDDRRISSGQNQRTQSSPICNNLCVAKTVPVFRQARIFLGQAGETGLSEHSEKIDLR
jgi:hypothetical protein